jgi:hypothetical protein
MHRPLAKAVLALSALALAACSSDLAGPASGSLTPSDASYAKEAKVTICHAAGLAGTTKYVSITISGNGARAHFLDNGTPKAGHELDFLATPNRPCNAPPAAQLTICEQSSGASANPAAIFGFVTSEGDAFTLHFTECHGPVDVVPGGVVIVQAHDPLAPAPSSYFATDVLVSGGLSVSATGFNLSRPSLAIDAVETVTTLSGQLTTVTFYNRN